MKAKPAALVTGAGGGIGGAICRALAQEGFRVGIHYRRPSQEVEKLQAELADSFLLRADLTDIDQVEALFSRLKEETGHLDVLVNNAGYAIDAPLAVMKIEEFDRQRALMRGTWYLTKRITRQYFMRRQQGRIINISSVVGHTGNAGQIPYSMEKAALDGFTRSLARELGSYNILVNSVAPGFIATEMTASLGEDSREKFLAGIPLGRAGLPEEVAEVVAFLATRGSYITGSVLHVNGGLYGG
jgi:3-oxoacyl-[acyl-carrier protein] reductase